MEVASAVELTPEQRDKLSQALKTRFKRDVHMTTTVDANLIGGAVIRYGDLFIDGSLRGRLARMQADFNG